MNSNGLKQPVGAFALKAAANSNSPQPVEKKVVPKPIPNGTNSPLNSILKGNNWIWLWSWTFSKGQQPGEFEKIFEATNRALKNMGLDAITEVR
jgi:hypothetical protein